MTPPPEGSYSSGFKLKCYLDRDFLAAADYYSDIITLIPHCLFVTGSKLFMFLFLLPIINIKHIITGGTMRKTGISLLLIISAFLILSATANSLAEDTISILNYSLKPVGYVSGDKFIQSIWNLELKNNDGASHSFNVKIVFYDKDKNQLKEVKKDATINASETKKYSDAILLEPEMAKKIASTKAFIEDVK
jgi:hypothetical protein